MKKLISLLLFPTVAFAAGPITPPTPRTAFGQELMLATNAEDGRAILDITASNTWFAGWASTTNQLVFTNKHKLTNLYDVKAITAVNGQALFFNTDGKWYPSNVTASISNAIVSLNGNGTNLILHSVGDATTNLILRVEDLGTRGAPIIQVIDANTGNLLLTLDNAAQLNANGGGVTNLNGANIQAKTLTTNALTTQSYLDLLGGGGSGIETNQHLTNIVLASYKDYTNSLPGLSNVIWVSPTANDAQAARGIFNRPYSLSNGINNAVSGDTILVLGGTYTNNTLHYWGVAPLVGSYHIQTKNHITIQGIGEVNIVSTNGGTTMMLWEASYVTIAGLNFIGTKNDYLWTTGGVSNIIENAGEVYGSITILHSTNIIIKDCKFIDNWGWGIKQAEFGFSWPSDTNIVVDRCIALNCGSSTTAKPSAGGAFHIYPGTIVRDCFVQRCMNGVWYYVPGTSYLPSPIVERTLFQDCNDYSITADGSHWVRGGIFRNNHMIRETNTAFYLPYMRTNLNTRSIYLPPWDDIVIEGNEFLGAEQGFVSMLASSGCNNQTNLVIRNNLFADQWSSGVTLGAQRTNYYTRILNNTFTRSAAYGVFWTGVNYDTEIRDNTITDYDLRSLGNYAIGFKLCAFGTNVTIDNNLIRANATIKSQYGMNLGSNIWNLRLGHNPTFNCVSANYDFTWFDGTSTMSNLAPVYFINPGFIANTNTDLNVRLITLSSYTNNIWYTNVLASTNWVGTLVTAGFAGGLTNLSDVATKFVFTDLDVLTWDNTMKRWTNMPASGGNAWGLLSTNALTKKIENLNGFGTNTTFNGIINTTNVEWTGGRVTYVPLNVDIQVYVNKALAGDTLILASGSYTQNTSIVITNQMNIVGQGSAGWVTDPTIETHGTRIATTSGNNVTLFDIRTNNVRFSSFSIFMTNGANHVGINIQSNLNGIVIRNVDITTEGGTPQYGIVVNASDIIIRDCTLAIPGVGIPSGTAYGILFTNGPTSTLSHTCDVYNLTMTVQGSSAGANAYGIRLVNSNSANNLVLNISSSQIRSPAAANVTNIALAAWGPNAIVNSYLCTLDGADVDVSQDGGSTINLGGSVIVNNLILGTPTYRAVMVSGAVTTTNLNLLGPALSYASTASNGPAANELPTAQWVRSLFNSGLIVYSSTNEIGLIATNSGSGQIMYSFIPTVPNYAGKRHYPLVNAGDYIGSVMWTNRFLVLQGPIAINAYLEMTNGLGGPSVAVHPEIYYSYNGTNWYGDWDAADQLITTGTNLYQWVVSFPTTTSTNSTGFYIQRRFKVGAAAGATHPGVVFHIGTNYYSGTNGGSFISFSGPSSASGNAYLANNQTFTGSNYFSAQITALQTNGPLQLVRGDWATNIATAIVKTPGGADFQLQYRTNAGFGGANNTGFTNETGTLGASNMILSGTFYAPTQIVDTLIVSSLSITNVGTNGVAYFDKAATNLTALPNAIGYLLNDGTGVLTWNTNIFANSLTVSNLTVYKLYMPGNGSSPWYLTNQGSTFAITNDTTGGLQLWGGSPNWSGSLDLAPTRLFVGSQVTQAIWGIFAINTNGITFTNNIGISNFITFKGSNSTSGLTFTTGSRTNSTNTILFDFGVPAVGEVFKVHSVSGQTAVVTNGVETASASTTNFDGIIITNKVGIGTNIPQFALDVIADNSATNIARFGTTNSPSLVTITTNGEVFVSIPSATPGQRMLWVGSNNTGTATLIITNGRVGIAQNVPAYALDVTGGARATLSSVFGSSLSHYVSVAGYERMTAVADGTLGFQNSGPLDFTGFVLGTNSVAAQAGWGASFPFIKKARTAGNGAGIKVTDQSDSTNGAFLELKAMMPATTNITPGADCIVIFAVTNATGVAQSWVMQEDGAMTQFSPHAIDAPPEFYVVTNWMRGIDPTIRVTRHMKQGLIEWNNDSLRSMMMEWMMAGTNMATVKLNQAVHAIETFEQYNRRTGSRLVRY